MSDKIEQYSEVSKEISVEDTVTRRVSSRRTKKQVLYDSTHSVVESDISSFISEDEKSYVTSTPHISAEDGINDHDKNLRVRRQACHRVHYSSDDLDESKHYCFEEKKRSKKQKRRMSLLQSISTKSMESEQVNVDTLENHLFPDMSFTESEMSYEESFNTTSKTDVSWSKLQGVSYSSKFDFSGDELDINSVINHPNRSLYRQKRREWYLNRRNRTRKTILTSHVTWWKRYFSQLIRIIVLITSSTYVVTSTITSVLRRACFGVLTFLYIVTKVAFLPFIYLLKLITYIFVSIKNTFVSIFTEFKGLFISKEKEVIVEGIESVTTNEKSSKKSRLFILFWLLFVAAIFSAILIGFNEEKIGDEEIIAPIPNPLKSGIKNAYPIYIASENVKIPAWHIYPNLPSPSSMHPKKHTLSDKSPVVMYLRQEGSVDAPKLKNLYQTLSSLGYHIVVPTNILSQHDVLSTWKWIKAQTNATAYLWGYNMNAEALTVTAKLFCKNLIPPNGVLIAKEIKNTKSQQSMEIWSCNCALSSHGDPDAPDFKYNHVKCPVAFNNDVNDVYSQVVACIETVNKKDVK